MNAFTSTIFVNLLLCLGTIHLTSSASFPNPPQRPPSNASPDEQALFWKLLHNYYAIIARPRFGKRSDLKSPSIDHLARHPIASSSSSEDEFQSLSKRDVFANQKMR